MKREKEVEQFFYQEKSFRLANQPRKQNRKKTGAIGNSC